MTIKVDLKGWWLVEDEEENTVVRQIEGVLEHAMDRAVARDPVTKKASVIRLEIWGVELFAPEDREAADAHAAHIIAEAKAEPDEDSDETEEAA